MKKKSLPRCQADRKIGHYAKENTGNHTSNSGTGDQLNTEFIDAKQIFVVKITDWIGLSALADTCSTTGTKDSSIHRDDICLLSTSQHKSNHERG